jgi:calcineurin-like phosphoesterase family protein
MISIFDKNIWFFSDPHYSHKNMCRGTSSWSVENTRNFATVEDMDTAIVNNINSVVGQNDLLFCLGDWNFGGIKNLPIFRHRINCKNVGLICGNHDNIHGSQWNPRIRVDHNKQDIRAADYFSYYQQYLEISVNKTPIILFHFPISSWNHMSKGSIHLFGHCHSKPEDRFFNGGKSMDVGLDGNNLMPYHIDEIFDLMSDRPVKKEGHHA